MLSKDNETSLTMLSMELSEFSVIEEDCYVLDEIEEVDDEAEEHDGEIGASDMKMLKGEASHAKQSTSMLLAALEADMSEAQDLINKLKNGTATATDKSRVLDLKKKISKSRSATEAGKVREDKLKTTIRAEEESRREAFRKIKIRQIKGMVNSVKKAESVDLAFIVDATSSMGPHIEAVKKNIIAIVTQVKGSNRSLSLRLAFVAYRDLCDTNRFEVLDFVKDAGRFQTFVGGIRASGGGDTPEDMAGGIQHANALSWRQATRVAFIVADCPCHGREFHSLGDDHPNGTPGIDIKKELRALIGNCGEGTMSVQFGRITAFCDSMIARFVQDGIHLNVVDFSNELKVKTSVTSSVRKSIFKTMSLASGGTKAVSFDEGPKRKSRKAALKPYSIEPRLPKSDEWTPVASVKVYQNKRIKSINDLQAPLSFGMLSYFDGKTKTDETKESKMFLRRAKAPFAEGGCRLAYHAELARKEKSLGAPKTKVVLKCFKHHGFGVNDRIQYLRQMEVSNIARFLAKEYNNSPFRPAHCARIQVLMSCVVEEEDDANEKDGNRRFCAEEVLPSDGDMDFTKFSNNTGYWDTDNMDETLLRFTKFTHEATNSYLMVTDLQGVKKNGKFYLTDPVILCRDIMRFGNTNLGETFMIECMGSTEHFMKENGWS
uniref:Alpha-type protein kinase domain-containing protein n=1 Tax=Craspedostauros australis TaxID=1486917 RepID=A0A7S0F6H6_9STRA|mmetsp:Transcript_8818/g.23821  ORF Transcript_8818/g.23821 Transcript_8818/m.23821 type:complete len:660 (+) Transcript_8818:173-2152(+)